MRAISRGPALRLANLLCAGLLGAGAIALAGNAHAQSDKMPAPPPCLDEAAAFHQVNPLVMRAIVWHESRNDFMLVTKNSNQSVDIGGGGINSVHLDDLKRFGIEPHHLLNGCVNTYVAAFLLSRQIKAYGNSWAAVAAYHSRNPANGVPYARKIRAVLLSWGIKVD